MFWKSRASRMSDLNAEMQTHLDMATRDRIARGESPEEAARNARRTFGDQTTVRESTSDMWSGDWPHQVAQEFKQAARSLARVPVFSLAAVLTLALGIGANTAIFSVINGVVLRPLPFAKPDQLVYITSQFPKMNLDHFPLDGAEFIELRERNHSFKEVGAYAVGAVNVGADESPRRVTVRHRLGEPLHGHGRPAARRAHVSRRRDAPERADGRRHLARSLADRVRRTLDRRPTDPGRRYFTNCDWHNAARVRRARRRRAAVDSAHPRSGESQSVSRRPLPHARRPSQGRRLARARAQRSGNDARAVERPRRWQRQAALGVLRPGDSSTRRIRWSIAFATTTCRATSSAASAARSGCFRRRWDSCCSSPARISPTCC